MRRAPSAMTQSDIALMRAYLRQWIDSPVWDMNSSMDTDAKLRLTALRAKAERIRTPKDVHDWIFEALGEGIDPL